MKLIVLVSAIFVSFAAEGASDTIYMDETVITGNQELPKVLYILPWREMESTLLPQRTLNFSSQSVLVPIYPEEHARELGFRKALVEARDQLANEQALIATNSED